MEPITAFSLDMPAAVLRVKISGIVAGLIQDFQKNLVLNRLNDSTALRRGLVHPIHCPRRKHIVPHKSVHYINTLKKQDRRKPS